MDGISAGQGERGSDMLVRKAAPSAVSLTLVDDPGFACWCDMVQQRTTNKQAAFKYTLNTKNPVTHCHIGRADLMIRCDRVTHSPRGIRMTHPICPAYKDTDRARTLSLSRTALSHALRIGPSSLLSLFSTTMSSISRSSTSIRNESASAETACSSLSTVSDTGTCQRRSVTKDQACTHIPSRYPSSAPRFFFPSPSRLPYPHRPPPSRQTAQAPPSTLQPT